MLSVKNLSFAFGTRRLFRGVSFEILPGSVTRIAGPNGAGKSTLLSIVAGLLGGATGDITFSKVDVDPRTWTAWVPPDANALNGSLSAVDNLKFWLDLLGSDKKDDDILKALSYWGLAGDYTVRHLAVSHFSTGMKRRLCLARLELVEATLWFLDEPLFGLDDKACQQFSERMRKHLASGGSALVITHDDRLLKDVVYDTIQLGGTFA